MRPGPPEASLSGGRPLLAVSSLRVHVPRAKLVIRCRNSCPSRACELSRRLLRAAAPCHAAWLFLMAAAAFISAGPGSVVSPLAPLLSCPLRPSSTMARKSTGNPRVAGARAFLVPFSDEASAGRRQVVWESHKCRLRQLAPRVLCGYRAGVVPPGPRNGCICST